MSRFTENPDEIVLKDVEMFHLESMNEPFYRFFAIDYFATGEGKSYWLMICRNYPFIGDKDRQKDKFVNFIGMGAEYYMHGFDELTEEEFMEKYDTMIPHHVKVQVHRRDQPMFTWQQHLHINYC